MDVGELLQEISDYCRLAGMAETTFGRRVVNDGKFASRLRYGGRVTTATVDRVHTFIRENPPTARSAGGIIRTPSAALRPTAASAPALSTLGTGAELRPVPTSGQSFRFFDNRQKYLMFVNTCSEKWVVAGRVAQELANLHPRPPAVRLFDAGVGDGTVLMRVLRAMHQRYQWVPFYVVAKEISLEDVRLTLEKMPDRLIEHPATLLILTNMYYGEAPWLTPASVTAATSLVWRQVALRGNTAAEFEQQITELQPFLGENWRASASRKTGNPVYEKPVVLMLYREDHEFLLNQVIPRRGAVQADYDLVIASQPYRARAPVEFKASRIIAPLVSSLAPGGRLIGIHSWGNDPGLEIIREIWPDENPFTTNRHILLKAVKAALGKRARDFNFNANSDARSLFRYDMHTLPNEIDADGLQIGTSTLLAAWNAATYVAQIEDPRLIEAMGNNRYLDATRKVLGAHGGLWFWGESYVISRKRGLV